MTDAQHNVTAMVAENGQVVERYAYDLAMVERVRPRIGQVGRTLRDGLAERADRGLGVHLG